MIIYKGSTRQVTTNFKENELFSKSFDAPPSHYLGDGVINALQSIRTYYNTPIRVTSTYRTPLGNSLCGGVPNSTHSIATAIDFQFIKSNNDFITRLQADWNSRSDIYDIIRTHGINAIGFYTNFIHIDTRPNEKIIKIGGSEPKPYPKLNTPTGDSFGTYQTWGSALDKGLFLDAIQHSEQDGFIELGQNKKFRFFFILIATAVLNSTIKSTNRKRKVGGKWKNI